GGAVLERAGAAGADALVAVTGGDNSNVVTARVARDAYRVPRAIARIHDPRRAALYEELGIVTVSSTGWALRRITDHLEHRPLREETTFWRGRGLAAAPGAAPAPGRPAGGRPGRRGAAGGQRDPPRGRV